MSHQRYFRRKRIKCRFHFHGIGIKTLFASILLGYFSTYTANRQSKSSGSDINLNLLPKYIFFIGIAKACTKPTEPLPELKLTDIIYWITENTDNGINSKTQTKLPHLRNNSHVSPIVPFLCNTIKAEYIPCKFLSRPFSDFIYSKLNVSENRIGDQIMIVLYKLLDKVQLVGKSIGLNFKDMGSVKVESETHNSTLGSYTSNSKLCKLKLNMAKSPGNMIQPSRFIICLSVILMLPAITSLSLSSPAPVTAEDLNKFKVIHTLNTVGRSVLLLVYKCFKRFPDTVTIKDHLINDKKFMTEIEYDKYFDVTMRKVIETSSSSGENFDISLLIKCIRALSDCYHEKWKWKWYNDQQLEYRCHKLAEKRNYVFHSFSGLTIYEMRKEIDIIESLITDILFSLQKRYSTNTSKINEISNLLKYGTETISLILTQPLAEIEIKSCLFQIHFQRFIDEIPSYKIICKNFGKIKILDFISVSSSLHDIKLLFTDVIVERSKRYKRNMSVKCTNIINMCSEFNIVLLDSEAGGGKSTATQYGLNDWSEGGQEMKTAGYNYIFLMIFRNTYLCSVAELIGERIPKVKSSMTNEDIINCISEPSLNILFVCDGFDEKNDNSMRLFREICDLKEKYAHIKLIVTSRPESVQELYHIKGPKLYIEHLKIRGIHENMRKDFLKKYHDELIKDGVSQENTEDLLIFYDSCSDRHKDLYRLPLNLVILSWLWGQNPQIVRTIKSAAGLYTAILDILNEKLINRIINSHPDVMSKIKNNIKELNCLIECFKEKVFSVSLIALRFDRIFIDKAGVDSLMAVCRDKGLPFLEMQGAYLLSSLEWNIKLEETLQIPHKIFLDFYTAKDIETKLSHVEKKKKARRKKKENRIKNIILAAYDDDRSKYKAYKYQNVLQLLGGILALKDPNLVEEHGPNIIELLIESGVRNNTQWYTVYSDFNVNTIAAEKFANLIAPHLDLDHIIIEDAYVEVLSTLLQYVHIDTATLDISSTNMLDQLYTLINVLSKCNCEISINKITDGQLKLWNFAITSNNDINIKDVMFDISYSNIYTELCALIDYLRSKKSIIKISKIEDKQVDLWNSSITQKAEINIDKVTVKIEQKNLSFLGYCHFVEHCCLQYLWRNLDHAAPDMSRCKSNILWTSVATTEALPKHVSTLYLGLIVDATTGAPQDPCLSNITKYCPCLKQLGLHLRAGTYTEHLSCLPKLSKKPELYLSMLSDGEDIKWAVDTAKRLQPTSGYSMLILPSSGLVVEHLCELVKRMGEANIILNQRNGLVVSSSHSEQEVQQLQDETHKALNCGLTWKQDDDGLDDCTNW